MEQQILNIHPEESVVDREKIGWLVLAENNLDKIWDNPIDENIWNQYL